MADEFVVRPTERTCADLARRGITGLWAHMIGMSIYAIATPAGSEYPLRIWPLVGLVCGVSAARAWLVWRLLAQRLSYTPGQYVFAHTACLVLTGLAWSALALLTVPVFGVRHWASGLLFIILAGISAGGITATAPSRVMMHLYTATIWLGALGTLAADWAHGWPTLVVCVLFNGYLHAQGARLNEEYRQAELREAQLEQATRVAQASSAAKDQFLANMSHEIRTPMNGILGSLSLAMEGELPAGQRAMIQVARHSAETLHRLLDDILDLSKIEAGRLEVERIAVEAAALCHTVGDLFRPAAEAKGLALSVEVDDGVPAWVYGDPTRLRQVLWNLVGNAVKFTAEGSVRICMRAEDKLLWFEVRDTGIGIRPDKQEAIFDAFVQADAGTTRRFGGTGLGLAISRQLVRLMGGKLELESEEGRGSCFRFALPLETAAAPADAAGSGRTGTLPGLRILLAEDAPVNQRVLTAMLHRLGQHVEVAGDGRAAVDAAAAGHFDLILMDVQMPEMNGLEATAAIRQRNTTLPIYGLSANAFAADRQRALEAGMNGYLTKPVAKADLEALIAQLAAEPPVLNDRPVA